MMFAVGLLSVCVAAGEADENMLLQGKKVTNHANANATKDEGSFWPCLFAGNAQAVHCCFYNNQYPGDVIGDDGTPACAGQTAVQCAETMNADVETARTFENAGTSFTGGFSLNGDSKIGMLLGPLISNFNFGSAEESDPLLLPDNAEVRFGQLPGKSVETFYWKVTIPEVPGNETAAFEIAKKLIFDKTAENFDPTFIDEQDLGGLPESFSKEGLDQARLPRLKFRRLDASPLLLTRELLYLTVKTDGVDKEKQPISLSTVPSVSNEWVTCKYRSDANGPPTINNDVGFFGGQWRSINLAPSLDRITKLHNNGATIEHVYTTQVGLIDFLPPALLRGATLAAYADEAIVVSLLAECEVNKAQGLPCAIEGGN